MIPLILPSRCTQKQVPIRTSVATALAKSRHLLFGLSAWTPHWASSHPHHTGVCLQCSNLNGPFRTVCQTLVSSWASLLHSGCGASPPLHTLCYPLPSPRTLLLPAGQAMAQDWCFWWNAFSDLDECAHPSYPWPCFISPSVCYHWTVLVFIV